MPSHVAASTVCAAPTDTSGSVCSLSASRRRHVRFRSAGHRPCPKHCPHTPLHRWCMRRSQTLLAPCARCQLPRRRQLRFRSAGHRPCRHTSLHRRCVWRRRTLPAPCALAVGFLDAVSSVISRLDTDCAITRRCIDGVCAARTQTLPQAPCARCRLPRRRQLSIRSAGHPPCRHTPLHRRCARRPRTLQSPCALAVGFLDAASADFGRRDTDHAVKRRFIDGHRTGTSIGGPSCVTDQISL